MATLIQSLTHILESKDPLMATETKRIILKEALQVYVLDFIYNHPDYRKLNFYGGTCLHAVYGLNRLSEDLDFDNSAMINVEQLSPRLADYFQKVFGYKNLAVRTQVGAERILRLTLRFPVLFEMGLSAMPGEMLHLKLELSHHHQIAIIQHTPVFNFGRSLVATHFSLETMMAGKMLACLERNFMRGTTGIEVKGRDYYDLLWFMQRHIRPLADKLQKDGGQSYSVKSAMFALHNRIGKLTKADLAVDLLPLFESRQFIEGWLDSFHENFERLVIEYL